MMVAPDEARFDPERNAWILSSYADVIVALREPRLSDGGSGSEVGAVATPRTAIHSAAARAFPAERLIEWRPPMERSARRLTAVLPMERTVDLMRAVAEPWSHELAMRVTGAMPGDAARLLDLARDVFHAAAHATGRQPQPDTIASVSELARALQGTRPSLGVQSFVALSQTLPFTLAGAWLALAEQPEVWRHLRAHPAVMPRVVDELLRLASPSRAVFRVASADVTIGEVRIRRSDQVILMLGAANRDPAQFPDPLRLSLDRGAVGHVGLGRGEHPCAGASIVRLAIAVATAALVDVADEVELVQPVHWLDGFAMRAPASLSVVLRRRRANGAPEALEELEATDLA